MKSAREKSSLESKNEVLKEILAGHGLKEYKIHFARHNGESHPLHVWVKNKNKWKKWQEYRPLTKKGKPIDVFNRKYIFALMQFHYEPNTWLFGGVYEVKDRSGKSYKVKRTNMGVDYIGRLKIYSPYKARATRTKMEEFYDDFEVKELLDKPISNIFPRSFPGFDMVNLSFKDLENLMKSDDPDWRNQLESVRGIYLITDEKTGKRYVGSASGDGGVWGRWGSYVYTGHANNKGIRELIEDKNLKKKERGLNYCRKNFHFSLLEHWTHMASKETIKYREGYWMEALRTLGGKSGSKWGLNKKRPKRMVRSPR